MYNADNEKLVAWTKIILISSGFWNLPITENPILKTLFRIYTVFMRLGCFMLWFLLTGELVRLVIGKYEAALIITSFGVAINGFKVMAKFAVYLRHDILEIFREVIHKEREIWQDNNEEIKALYKRNIRCCKFYAIILGCTTLMGVLFLEITGGYSVFQLIEYNKANNASLESHFMYQTLFPLNKLDHLYWMFATQIYVGWVGLTFNCGMQMIFITLLVYAASQMQILQIRLKHYIGPNFGLEAGQEEVEDKIASLKSLIRDHQYIIRFIKHVNECTKYLIMMEFILSSLDMASVSVNLIKMRTSELGWMLFFFMLLMIQILLIGWTCNEIKTQSEAIGDAIYESKWYLLNKEAKQLTEIVISRAQRPLLMTIGPFGPMTTHSVLMVLKAAYSYVSIMKD